MYKKNALADVVAPTSPLGELTRPPNWVKGPLGGREERKA